MPRFACENRRVSEAGNGAEGIDLYERDPPDLIITDILMPEKEGIETIMALHRAAEVREARTSCAWPRNWAPDTLLKPFRGDQLLGAVSESLSANSS